MSACRIACSVLMSVLPIYGQDLAAVNLAHVVADGLHAVNPQVVPSHHHLNVPSRTLSGGKRPARTQLSCRGRSLVVIYASAQLRRGACVPCLSVPRSGRVRVTPLSCGSTYGAMVPPGRFSVLKRACSGGNRTYSTRRILGSLWTIQFPGVFVPVSRVRAVNRSTGRALGVA